MFDLDHATRLLSENLTRSIDRRTFLKRTSQAMMTGLMAVAAGHALPGRAAATTGGPRPPLEAPACNPPGPYCNSGGGSLSGCHGGHCFQHLYGTKVLQCRVYYQYYQTGCWTTASGGGYWTCCDCECLNGSGQRVSTCGCAQFSGSPAPLPAGPGGKVGN